MPHKYIDNIILASKSETRIKLLKNAGVTFESCPSNVDEDVIKKQFFDKAPSDVAMILAYEKAKYVSNKYPSSYILGCDQVMDFKGKLLSKSKTYEEAKERLIELRGNWHTLCSAVCIFYNKQCVFENLTESKLLMRKFTDEFIDEYLESVEDTVLASVGCYQLEKQGIQLFEEIKGDYFDILGFPLLPILNFLQKKQLLRV